MDDRSDYASIFETLTVPDVSPDALSETIVAEAATSLDTINLLPKISFQKPGSSVRGDFAIRGELGRGGMGVVHLGHQHALDREVAIKTVTQAAPESLDALMLEGRIMSIVEHPNVVPVHVMGLDETNAPIVVMKRIVGAGWDEVMLEPHEDSLGRDLRILRQVINALELSHSKGIIHRDLKPSNVMVGEFGEVYLVDWGLAVAVDERYSNVPLAVNADAVVGTPAYIAPEMTVGDGGQLGFHTDIYLTGAVLYHVLNGTPPHRGTTLFELLRSSYEGWKRDYDPTVPPELASICERALATKPEQRFSTIGELLAAIDDFIEHRNSSELTQQAIRETADLQKLIATHAAEEEVYAAFRKIRFTFQNAIAIWEQNIIAISRQDDVIKTMVQFELDQDDPISAEKLVAQLANRDETLHLTVRNAVEARGLEIDGLKKLEHDINPDVSTNEKSLALFVVALCFLSVTTGEYLDQWFALSEETIFIGLSSLFLGPLTVISILYRKAFFANFANRVALKSFWVLYVFTFSLRVIAVQTGTATNVAISLELLLLAAGAALLMLSVDRRLFFPSFALGIGAIFAATSTTPFFIYAISGFVGFGASAVATRFFPTTSIFRFRFFSE